MTPMKYLSNVLDIFSLQVFHGEDEPGY